MQPNATYQQVPNLMEFSNLCRLRRNEVEHLTHPGTPRWKRPVAVCHRLRHSIRGKTPGPPPASGHATELRFIRTILSGQTTGVNIPHSWKAARRSLQRSRARAVASERTESLAYGKIFPINTTPKARGDCVTPRSLGLLGLLRPLKLQAGVAISHVFTASSATNCRTTEGPCVWNDKRVILNFCNPH